MSDERRDASAQAEGLKVNDRRRFTREGEPTGGPADEGAAELGESRTAPGRPIEGASVAGDRSGAEAAQGSGEHERKIAEQAARIEELSRALSALVEDNKRFRQRIERENARIVEAERASVAQALLEAADELERALAALSGAAGDGGEALRGLADGVRLSLGALQKKIAEIGAVRLEVAGQPFDPRVAEAIDTVTVGSPEADGVVVQEVRPGYRIGDRVLRPARVRVGRLARA